MSRVMEQGAPWERDDSSLPEADIVARVEAFLALEVEKALEPGSVVSKELKNLTERIEKAGENIEIGTLAAITSFLSGDTLCCVMRRADRKLAQRAVRRSALPEVQPRVTGTYELNSYGVERKMRDKERQDGCVDVKRHERHLTKVLNAGYTKRFRRFVLQTSFFSIVHVCRLAAADFLRSPNLMMSTYLELSAAVEHIARSGLLSKSASMRAFNFAEALELAPAACLDYFE